MKRLLAAAAALVLVCGLAGCMAGMTLRSRQKYVANHPGLDQEVRQAILEGVIMMGMTKDQVVASIGRPNDENISTYEGGETTQFCYGEIGSNFNFNRYRYVYFTNGKVTGWDQ